MFYFFFESRKNKSNDPVVIWLSGGPGCSSSVALFYENGPFTISDDLSLSWNNFGWDQVSNIIYVDQPMGTGFSYASNDSYIPKGEEGVSEDLYRFLQAFFQDHPEFSKNDFYITGESYAGHYIPALASRINKGNKKTEGLHINLKGFAIGNGLTNPEIQYGAYADYAQSMNLISKSVHERADKDYIECQISIKKCNIYGGDSCDSASLSCEEIFNLIMSQVPDINYYDVRKKCIEGPNCYDFSKMEKFLNQENVQKALRVHTKFKSCNDTVYDSMSRDEMRNLEDGIPELLEDGINVLIYAGEYDLICNWLGNSRWVENMTWSGNKNYVLAKTLPFLVQVKKPV